MLKGLSLTALAQKIEANQSNKKDFIAVAKELHVGVNGSDGVPALIVPDQGAFPINSIAHRQIGTFTGIPAQYYDRMLQDQPNLLADNINAWFRRFPVKDKRLVRTMGGVNRALLSNSYQRIENEEIAEVALPVLAELPDVKIVSCEITDRRLYIHFVVPGIQAEVRRGDIVQAGGIISNSEVGFGSVSVSGLIWRLACLNGLKTSETFRRAHIGRKVDDNEALWADDTKRADDKAVLLKVRDMVKSIVDHTRFIAQVDKMRGLADVPLTGDMTKSVEVLTQKLTLPDSLRPSILRSLAEGGDLTAWGVVNAVTHQAHKVESYDRAVELEAAGGQLLDLAPGEWRKILEAA